MDCTRIRTLIPVFLGRELSPADRSDVADHLETCQACRERLPADPGRRNLPRGHGRGRVETPDLWPALRRRIESERPRPGA